MAIKFSNNASGTLSSSITAVATTITLTSGNGALFPALSGSDYFYATLCDSSNNLEIVKVTSRTSDTLVITRAQEGTSARAYAAGDKFELRPTAQGLTDVAAGTNIVNLPVAQGGTGTNTASGARANLGTVNDPGSNGIMARTAGNTATARTITAGAGITVADGDGATANPTITNNGVRSITAGNGIAVDNTNPNAPTVSNAGVTSFNGSTGDVLSPAPTKQTFTASGTWTKPSGLRAVRVRVLGAGGAGGSATRSVSGKTVTNGWGGGGGSGGYSEKLIPAASLGATEAVTVGATSAASSSFGAHLTATGGSAGGSGGGTNAGGIGGTSSGGDVNVAGSRGDYSDGNGRASGAASLLSPSTTTGSGNGDLAGVAGSVYGSGGSGAVRSSTNGTSGGGAAAAGIVIVEEFY